MYPRIAAQIKRKKTVRISEQKKTKIQRSIRKRDLL